MARSVIKPHGHLPLASSSLRVGCTFDDAGDGAVSLPSVSTGGCWEAFCAPEQKADRCPYRILKINDGAARPPLSVGLRRYAGGGGGGGRVEGARHARRLPLRRYDAPVPLPLRRGSVCEAFDRNEPCT